MRMADLRRLLIPTQLRPLRLRQWPTRAPWANRHRGEHQTFWDLTYMQANYIGLGVIGDTISFWINMGDTEAVVRSSTELPCSTACYVNAVTGSDANPGTSAWPFRTIQGHRLCGRPRHGPRGGWHVQ